MSAAFAAKVGGAGHPEPGLLRGPHPGGRAGLRQRGRLEKAKFGKMTKLQFFLATIGSFSAVSARIFAKTKY